MKLFIMILSILIIAGCQPNNGIKEAKIDGYAISQRVTDKGVECVIYRVSSSYKSGGGISCNWDKYNKESESK